MSERKRAAQMLRGRSSLRYRANERAAVLGGEHDASANGRAAFMDAATSEVCPPPALSSPMTSAVTIESVVPLEIFELRYVLAVLELHKGNKARAAKALVVSRRSLYRLLDRAAALGMV